MPLLPEVAAVLWAVIGERRTGLMFLREKLVGTMPKLVGDKGELEGVLHERVSERRGTGAVLRRPDVHQIARKVWWDAGAVKADVVRNTFVRIMARLNRSEATCPKSWRHSFATLLQDANVDPLIRQQVMGHRPTNANGLGMTANYTHTRGELLREQIERALRRWPDALRYAVERVRGANFGG